MKNFSEIKDRKIILDTNVIINYSQEGFKELSGNFLRVLADNGNQLATSSIVALELFKGKIQKELVEKYINFLKHIDIIEVSLYYLLRGARLCNDYRHVLKLEQSKFPTGDLVIGGTVVGIGNESGKDALLLTADRNDFREPVWKCVAHHPVFHKDQSSVKLNFYLLQINRNILSKDPLRRTTNKHEVQTK